MAVEPRVITLGAAGSQLVGLTTGEFVAFTMPEGEVSGPVLRLSRHWRDSRQFRPSVERLGDILDIPAEPGTRG